MRIALQTIIKYGRPSSHAVEKKGWLAEKLNKFYYRFMLGQSPIPYICHYRKQLKLILKWKWKQFDRNSVRKRYST